MGIEFNASNAGSMAWKGFNTLLGAAGTAMGATALGSKTSEEKVREIFREEVGRSGILCPQSVIIMVWTNSPQVCGLFYWSKQWTIWLYLFHFVREFGMCCKIRQN